VFLLIKGAAARLSGSFLELWQHACLDDVVMMLGTSTISGVVAVIATFALPGLGATPRVAALDAVLTVWLLGALRIGPRLLREVLAPSLRHRRRAVVLVGRMEALGLAQRKLAGNPDRPRVVGLVVDGLTLEGARLHQVPVWSCAQLAERLAQKSVAEVTTVPPLSQPLASLVAELCLRAGVPCRPVPSPDSLIELCERGPEILFDRPAAADLDEAVVGEVIRGRRVLVTGAGGSIGSELARQVARFGPSALALIDRSENALFLIERDLAERRPDCDVHARIADVQDRVLIQRLFDSFRPEAVFHAAAYKHVPMMERHPAEAVLNNVLGTRNVACAADRVGTERFVFISTDKAVNPSSVMGATKRIGELYTQSFARRSATRFVSVRFGNVFGSNGSVIPIFIEQIRRGGPVTVTHPEMRRYFMSIPEACQLVLQAAALGEGGEVFVLDMGTQVRIFDVARRLIERAGLRPGQDVPIVFSGTRPGEKLHEELTLRGEHTEATRHPAIRMARPGEVDRERLDRGLEELERLASAMDDAAVVRKLSEIVFEYRPVLTGGPTGGRDGAPALGIFGVVKPAHGG
jgi:FlaA1/EpsC-like NDP-sugar epimerase